MKKRMILSLLLTMSLMLSACGGNGAKDGGDGSTNEGSTGDEDTTLTVWIKDNILIEDFNTNSMTLWLEEQTGYNLEMIPQSSDGYADKVNVALTAGAIEELPDIIMGQGGIDFTDSQVWSYAEAGSIISLTDYYNDPELAVNINEAIERTGTDYTQLITSPDGNIYSIGTLNQSYGNEFKMKLWVYKPWLEALNKEVPATTEEFYELLTQIHETDLNGNGKQDEIGMLGPAKSNRATEGYWKVLMNAFVYAGDTQYRMVEDGVVSASYTTDEWKEGLKYLKSLFGNGAIPTESLTMSEDQFKALLNSADPTVFAFTDYTPDDVDQSEGRHLEYICIDTLTGPDGVNYATYEPSVATPSMMITANCKNPEAAFRIGDLLNGMDMSISQRWGEEGVDWDYIENVEDSSIYKSTFDGFDLSIVAYDDASFWAGTDTTNRSWKQVGPYVRHYGIYNGVGVEVGNESEYLTNVNSAMAMYQEAGHGPEEVIPKLIFTTEESETISTIETVLKSYVEESMASFVTGTMDIDADWDSYLAELETIGLKEYLEVVQGAYDRMYK